MKDQKIIIDLNDLNIRQLKLLRMVTDDPEQVKKINARISRLIAKSLVKTGVITVGEYQKYVSRIN